MDRELVFNLLFEQLNASLAIAIKAATDARDLATHEQSKPETQYDTVGLEASYLAHGQSQRVNDLQLAIEDWQQLKSKLYAEDSKISTGAIVELKGSKSVYYYLLGNFSGGVKLQLSDKFVTAVSILSPIGEQLSEKEIGDEIKSPATPPEYLEITAIY